MIVQLCKPTAFSNYDPYTKSLQKVLLYYSLVLPNCSTYLVSGPHGVRDNQMTAKSVYDGQWKGSFQPYNARLTSPKAGVTDNAWCSGFVQQAEWIQVHATQQTQLRLFIWA